MRLILRKLLLLLTGRSSRRRRRSGGGHWLSVRLSSRGVLDLQPLLLHWFLPKSVALRRDGGGCCRRSGGGCRGGVDGSAGMIERGFQVRGGRGGGKPFIHTVCCCRWNSSRFIATRPTETTFALRPITTITTATTAATLATVTTSSHHQPVVVVVVVRTPMSRCAAITKTCSPERGCCSLSNEAPNLNADGVYAAAAAAGQCCCTATRPFGGGSSFPLNTSRHSSSP